MTANAYVAILAGGKGERFWPLSTSRHPKQVLKLVGGKSFLEAAVERMRGLVPPERILIITGRDLAPVVRRAVPQVPARNVIGEPFGRDTAAACALALTLIKHRCANAAVCVLTADHVIRDDALFRRTLRESLAIAGRDDVIITIGIRPTFPSTGFGYIEAGAVCERRGPIRFRKAIRFVEKPDARTARAYLATGRHLWNSGMFVWGVRTFERALAAHQPALWAAVGRLAPWVGKAGFPERLRRVYATLEKVSVDYAVMEKARNIVMAEGMFRWDDVGSWTALAHHFAADRSGNVAVGTCEAVDAEGNIVVSPDRLTALVGVRDLVVVQSPEATLVCAKDKAQDVRKLVRLLAARRRYGRLL